MKIKSKIYILMLFILISSSLCSCCSCIVNDYDKSQQEAQLNEAIRLYKLNLAILGEGDPRLLEMRAAIQRKAEWLLYMNLNPNQQEEIPWRHNEQRIS